VGTDVSLLLKLAHIKKELMLQGVVTWVQQHEPTGMGIRFKDVDQESKKILSDALQ
jgi:Tfp pilus assembly protein PilZ